MIDFNLQFWIDNDAPDRVNIRCAVYGNVGPENMGRQILGNDIFYSGNLHFQTDRATSPINEFIKMIIMKDETIRRNYKNYEFNKNIGAV